MDQKNKRIKEVGGDMIHRILVLERLISVLNDAIELDVGAMKRILEYNVTVTREFAEHFNCSSHDGVPVVSFLTLLNAMFGFDSEGKSTIGVAAVAICPNCGKTKAKDNLTKVCPHCVGSEGELHLYQLVPVKIIDLERR